MKVTPIYEAPGELSGEGLLTSEGQGGWNVFLLFSRKEVMLFERRVKEMMEKGVFESWLENAVGKTVGEYGYESVFRFVKRNV